MSAGPPPAPPRPGALAALRATRRGFLGLAGATAALAALPTLRALPAAAAPSAGARFFDAYETEILTQLAERICDTGTSEAPRLRETATIATVDAFCVRLDPALSGALPLALRLFEWGPLVFELTPTRFTRMSDPAKDASLSAWMTSRLAIRRQAFLAVRNLCLVGWYSQPEVWKLVGYAGPLLGARARA
jgi:hypothetical protein